MTVNHNTYKMIAFEIKFLKTKNMKLQFPSTNISVFVKKAYNTETLKKLRLKVTLLLFLFVYFGQQLPANPLNNCISQETLTSTTQTYKYQIFDYFLNWDEAEAYCESIGGHLATITSETELNYILSILEGHPSIECYWLGGTDKETEGTWKWITNENWEYTNWEDGEPNNTDNEDYLAIYNFCSNYSYPRGTWNDGKIASPNGRLSEFGFICEWEAVGISEISPEVGYTNQEYLDITIYAYPIDSTSYFILTNNTDAISPDFIITTNTYYLTARFFMNEQTTGKYNALLISQGDTMKLDNCFTLIELTDIVKPTDTDNDGYYNISSFANLAWIFETDSCWSWNFELDNDIDASESKDWYDGEGFNPITNFSGIIDGQGHKIKHLYFNRPDDYVAFIGELESSGIIRNIELTNCDITGNNYTAALVGKNDEGTISNCYTSGTIDGNEYVGGIAGNSSGTIKVCYNSATVNGKNNVGGINGYSESVNSISKCYNLGKIIGDNLNIGGIVGYNNGSLNNCYNAGTIIGAGEVAGITGRTYGPLTNTYNIGYVNGTGSNCGAVNGYGSGSVTNSYYNLETSGFATSKGGTGKNTAEMKQQSTYANWDFDETWEIFSTLNDGYPQLSWATTTKLISSYSPERVAQGDTATIIFEGINFDDETNVYLYKSGQDTLKADTVYTTDTKCAAQFDFSNTSLGLWDILVQYTDTIVTFTQGLTIEEKEEGKLNIEVLGADKFRKGRTTTVAVNITNSGNTTKEDACIVVAIDSDDDDFYAYFEGFTSVDKEVFDSLGFDVREFYFMKTDNLLGHDRTCKVGIFYLHDLSAYGTKQLEFSIKSNGDYTLAAWESDYPKTIFEEDVIASIYTDGEEHTYNESSLKSAKTDTTAQNFCESLYSKCFNDYMSELNDILLEEGKEELCGQLLDLIPIESAKTIATAGYDMVDLCKEMNEATLTGDTDGLLEAAGAVSESDIQGSIISYTQEVLINIVANKKVVEAITDGTIDKLVSSGSATTRSAAKKAIRKTALKSLSKLSKGAEIAGYLLSYGGVWALRTIQAKELCSTSSLKGCEKPSDAAKLDADGVGSFDPNDKYGYRSPTGSTYFNEDQTNFTYVINFENKDSATAAAQEVFITDTLDLNSFDIESFKAGQIKIGKNIYDAPLNVQENKWTIDMRPDMDLITYVTLSLNKEEGIAKWYFRCVDPETMNWPEDVTTGFLPPNDSTGQGEGSVMFTIDLKDSLVDDASISNKATIVFDTNAPIVTPTWINTKDIAAPESYMNEPEVIADTTALISWAGEDNLNGSGIYCYNLFVKKGNGDYEQLLSNSASTSLEFAYETRTEYSFYVTAVDSAGNEEVKTSVPDITMLYYPTGINECTIDNLDDLIKVYPNPTQNGNEINIEISIDNFKNSYLIVSNLSGQIIYRKQDLQQKMTINGLSKGCYLIQVCLSSNNSVTKKIIVK